MPCWHPPTAHAPESFTEVLIAVHGAPQAAEGFRTDTGIWWFSTGHEVPGNAVYAWTELPACPAL